MHENTYPKRISYDGPRNLASYTPGFHDLCREVMTGMRMTMLDENILQIEYPANLVKQIRTVNVDDSVFRLDFILTGHDTRVCFFPYVPWGRKDFFQNKRFLSGQREEKPGKLIITYPKL